MELPEQDPDFERWPPAHTVSKPEWDMPDWPVTIWRGVCCRCPRCGEGKIFDGYLKVMPKCAVCGAPLGDMPADDAPPYIAMVVVLHFVAFFVVGVFKFGYMPGLYGAIMWLALLAIACCIALRLAKGAVIGILLKLGLKREALRG